MPDYQYPKRVSINALQEVIIGWYQAGAGEEEVRTSDVESAYGISSDSVSRQTAFLNELSIVSKDGYDVELTSTGSKIAEALVIGDTDTAKRLFRERLEEWSLHEPIISIVNQNNPKEEGIQKRLAKVLGLDLDSSHDRTTLGCIIDLYKWAEIIETNDQNEFGVVDYSGTIVTESEGLQSENSNPGPVRTSNEFMSPQTPLSISFDVTPEADPTKVEEIIVAIRRGFEMELQDDVDNDADHVDGEVEGGQNTENSGNSDSRPLSDFEE